MVKSAQDLERKLMPWKQAREMFLPWREIMPPMRVPRSAEGGRTAEEEENMVSLLPLMCSSTRCQWR